MNTSSASECCRRPGLKIISVIARLNVGGAAREVVLEARAARDRGHDVLLVHGTVGGGEGSLEALAAEHGLRTIKLDALGPRLNALNDVYAAVALFRVFVREAPDVIHTHTAKAGALGRVCATAFNCLRPQSKRALIVHSFHGHVLEGYFGRVGNALVRAAERALGLLSDVVVTISSRQRTDIVDRFRVVPSEKAALVRYGLDFEPLLRPTVSSNLRRVLGIDSNATVFGYVGRFVPVKDLRTLVDAFAIVVQKAPLTYLVMAGDGPLRPDIEGRASELGIADNVRFIGWTKDLADLYSAFDVCVLSSLNEGTPVAAIEAMALGKPVVATAVGGVPDVVREGCGVLVPARDSSALGRAMLTLADSPAIRVQLGAAAKRHVTDQYSPARLADDFDNLYNDRLFRKRGTIARTT